MTDAGPRFLPGQPIGYGMTPGVHHDVTDDRYDLGAPKAPYGMTPGQRHVIPDQIDLDAPPTPEQVQLDDSPHPLSAPPGNEHKGSPIGWRVRDSAGNVVAELHNVNTRDYQAKQVEAVGQSLIEQAITPEDKEAAQRATAFGKAMVGIAPSSEITKRMVAQYDTDIRNGISRSIQAEKSKRAAMRGSGGPGPAGPTKAQKFENQVDLDDAKLVESVVNNEQAQSKVNALRDMESDLDKLEAMVSSPDALAQRAAIMEYMKTLSGKQSTDIERRNLANANGIWDSMMNNIGLWTNDATLTKGYLSQFKRLVATLRGSVNKRKSQIGKEASDRLTHQPRFAGKDEATKKALGNYGRGVVTGDYGDSAFDPSLLK